MIKSIGIFKTSAHHVFVEVLEGSDRSSGVEVGLGHAVAGKLDGVLVLPLVAVLKERNTLEFKG